MSADPEPDIKAFLVENAIHVDQTVRDSPGRRGITGTPTVLIVDSSGRVLRSFVGLLSSGLEEEVRRLVTRE